MDSEANQKFVTVKQIVPQPEPQPQTQSQTQTQASPNQSYLPDPNIP